jgi:hypothetical protein
MRPKTELAEIAEKLGVTVSRVHEIEVSALRKLRHPSLRKKWELILATIDEIENNRAVEYSMTRRAKFYRNYD